MGMKETMMERVNRLVACFSRTTDSTNVDVVKAVASTVVGSGVTVFTGVRVERTRG